MLYTKTTEYIILSGLKMGGDTQKTLYRCMCGYIGVSICDEEFMPRLYEGFLQIRKAINKKQENT